MTYRSLITSCSFATAIALSLVACGDVDDPGSIAPSSDSSPDDDPPPEEPPADDVPPADDEPPADDPPMAECSESLLELTIGEKAPSGLSGKEVVDLCGGHTIGTLTHAGGESSDVSLKIEDVDEIVSAVHGAGGEGCEEYVVIKVRAELAISSGDGTFDDVIRVTLIHHSADPSSVEIVSDEVAWGDLAGKLEPPEAIGPEASPPEAFDDLRLSLRAVVGEPRPMATVDGAILEDVHGVILGRGELAELSCPDLEGGECDPSRDFFIGSLLFKGE